MQTTTMGSVNLLTTQLMHVLGGEYSQDAEIIYSPGSMELRQCDISSRFS